MNKFKDKTAIGIVTCDRPEFYKKCIDAIDENSGRLYVINAGSKEIPFDERVSEVVLDFPKPIPVGIAKNKLIREMRNLTDNVYLFVVEDDVLVKDNNVFQKYIETAEKTGLWGCLSYGGHGHGNKNSEGDAVLVKQRVKYDENISIDLYHNSLAAFQLYHTNIFREIGYFDERFVNAAEHLDHYVEQYLKGIAPPFWYFPDIEDSWKYLEDLDNNHSESIIRKRDDFNEIIRSGWELFRQKRKVYPSDIPQESGQKVLEILTKIEKNYGR